MKKHLITGLFAALALTANAQSFKEWLDPEVNAVNRAPMHANYFAYESADAAMKGEKAKSANYMTLNGTWKFFWVPMLTNVLPISGKSVLTTKAGMICRFPLYGS